MCSLYIGFTLGSMCYAKAGILKTQEKKYYGFTIVLR